MWDRKVLKANGKVAFKANYWKCVLVSFLAALGTGTYVNTNTDEISEMTNQMPSDVLALVLVIAGGISLIGLALTILVFNPLNVSCSFFFIKNSEESEAPLDYLSRGFKGNYWNTVLVMFLRDLFIALWTLLLIVPGIINVYAYRMVPYILAENPDMNYKEALDLSSKMMYGNKWKSFVLDLSFIGWIILSILTFGILLLFYVNPYIGSTNAELYKAIKAEYNGETPSPRVENAVEEQTITFEVSE